MLKKKHPAHLNSPNAEVMRGAAAAGGAWFGSPRSAGENDCTVCLKGKKCRSEAVARAE